jgi:hypothetical protein
MMRPARTAQDTVREALAAMNDRQFTLAAKATGVSCSALRCFADGRSGSLPAHSLHRLGEHIFSGRYFVKREERAT